MRKIIFTFLTTTLILPCTYSQYFGRNKVNYEKFPFEVLESPHFKIYHYVEDKPTINWFAKSTEQWYRMHQAIFADTFKEKNPVILYNTHSGFQQTNVIDDLIGAGTGGVTEGLKNRVVMPFFESRAQTDHVLGHELVHAFQYHLVRTSDSLSLSSLGNLPLWMVEGLAEYMSIGANDPLTALWLRSAVLNNRLPTLKDMTNKPDLYFPYRWGQAFWAYVTGIYGDNIIKPLFMNTARVGYKDAIKRVLGLDEKIFSEKWQQAIRNAYSPFQKNTSLAAIGTEIINKKNAGRLNIVPSISPDGKLLAFWTEKDLFNIDLYLAEAGTGNIIRKLNSNSFSSHIDEYNSFESSVAWSPDSRQIAFVVFSKGKNQLLIVDTDGKVRDKIELPGVHGFSNPAWSPDGKTIVVSGLVNGQSDLYAFDLATKTLKQLTDDIYSDLLPSWSPDGKWIVFSTDRISTTKTVQHEYAHNIALYNVATGKIQSLDFFAEANNLNPVFGNDNRTVYFLSDQDGFRNLYSVDIQTGELSKLTNLYTGITGITLWGPAISVSRSSGQVVYSYYTGEGDYHIYTAHSSVFKKENISVEDAGPRASMLPPFERTGRDIVQRNIENAPYPLISEAELVSKPYRATLQLEYLSNSGGIGVSTGAGFSPGIGGGVNGIFSDALGNHQLFGSLAINGEVYDFGGQFAYFNRNNRINWGVGVSHIPYLSGLQRLFLDSLVLNSGDTVQVINSSVDILRTYQEQLFLFASYPFSQTRRLEAGGSFARYHYRLDRYTDYYTLNEVFIGSERNKLPVPKGFNFGQAYLAFVGDNSQFGVASPLIGHRFRFEAGQYFGVADMQTALADYRKYFRAKPFTIAFRNMFVGRFGKDAESGIIPPFYIGDPYFIRGYQALDFATKTGNEVTINDLLGSRIFITNAELRFPFTGPERLSAIRSRIFFTELNLFTDGGIAWGNAATPSLSNGNNIVARDSKFILSSGVSLRVNLFGYLVIEPFYAVPWQNGGFKNANFGLNFIPGW